jgi:hypothetical protein
MTDGQGTFWTRTMDDIEPMLRHTAGMLVAIICIWSFDKLLGIALGDDPKLFDVLPLKYVGHTGDILAITRFMLMMVIEIKKVVKNEKPSQ